MHKQIVSSALFVVCRLRFAIQTFFILIRECAAGHSVLKEPLSHFKVKPGLSFLKRQTFEEWNLIVLFFIELT